jgi:hypothetical protein
MPSAMLETSRGFECESSWGPELQFRLRPSRLQPLQFTELRVVCRQQIRFEFLIAGWCPFGGTAGKVFDEPVSIGRRILSVVPVAGLSCSATGSAPQSAGDCGG